MGFDCPEMMVIHITIFRKDSIFFKKSTLAFCRGVTCDTKRLSTIRQTKGPERIWGNGRERLEQQGAESL
jgi:hypothetical protein